MQLLLQFQKLIIVKVQSASYSQSALAHDPLQAAQDSTKTECNTLECSAAVLTGSNRLAAASSLL